MSSVSMTEGKRPVAGVVLLVGIAWNIAEGVGVEMVLSF